MQSTDLSIPPCVGHPVDGQRTRGTLAENDRPFEIKAFFTFIMVGQSGG